jgi:hypothetical protein
VTELEFTARLSSGREQTWTREVFTYKEGLPALSSFKFLKKNVAFPKGKKVQRGKEGASS